MKRAASGEAARLRPGVLKDELRLQLNHSRRSVGSQSRTVDCGRLADGLGDLSELAAVGVRVRKGKVRMIEEVKESCSNRELRALPFGYVRGFLHVEVGVEVTGATKLIATLGVKIIGWDVRGAYHIGENRSRAGGICASKQTPLQYRNLLCVEVRLKVGVLGLDSGDIGRNFNCLLIRLDHQREICGRAGAKSCQHCFRYCVKTTRGRGYLVTTGLKKRKQIDTLQIGCRRDCSPSLVVLERYGNIRNYSPRWIRHKGDFPCG
jgi:hypothetical protein